MNELMRQMGLRSEDVFSSSDGGVTVETDTSTFVCTREEGVICVTNMGKNKQKEEIVCGYLRPVARCKSKDGLGFSLRLEFIDQDNNLREVIVTEGEIIGTGHALCQKLANLGLRVMCSGGQRGLSLLNEYLKYYPREKLPIILTVSTGGWLDDKFNCFVFANKTLKTESAHETRPNEEADLPRLTVVGTLSEWKATTGAAAMHSRRLMFGIMASLAAPLVEVLGRKTTVFNFYGKSGIGKSTILIGAASVWGRPCDYLNSWESTKNAFSGLAVKYNNLPLIFDELKQATQGALDDVAYRLGNETEKARLGRDLKAREQRSWSQFVLSTGEETLSDIRKRKNGTGVSDLATGERVRFPDIPADARKGLGVLDSVPDSVTDLKGRKAFIDAYKTPKYCGAPGESFLTRLVERIGAGVEAFRMYAEERIAAFESEFARLGSDQLRVLSAFSVVAFAGELAAQWEIVPWDENASRQAVHDMFDAWCASDEAPEARAEATVEAVKDDPKKFRNYYRVLTLGIDSNNDSTEDFIEEPKQTDRNVGAYGLIIERNGEGVVVLYDKEQQDALRNRTSPGLSIGEFRDVLADAGVLHVTPGEDRKLYRHRSKKYPKTLVFKKRYLCIVCDQPDGVCDTSKKLSGVF